MATTVTEPDAPRPSDAGGGEPPAGAISQAGEQRSARVESLRAVAALSVVASHIFLLALAFQGIGDSWQNRVMTNMGSFGLYLFFALSGYLLFLPFARHQFGRGQAIDVRRYARNRALRILPLYLTAVTVLLVFRPFDADRADWWRYVLLIQNYSPETLNRLNAPLWTITLEVQFYIALPFMAWAVAKLAGRSFRRTFAILLAVGLASYALRAQQVLFADYQNVTGAFGKYSLPTLLYAFVAGMLVAVLRLAWEERPPGWTALPVLGAASAWIAAGVALELVIAYDFDWQEPFVALVAALIVGGCVLPLRPGRLVHALQWRPLALLGVVSYSIYIWHAPITLALSDITPEAATGAVTGDPTDFASLLAIGIPLCIAAGAVSYLLIERPFLLRRRRWGTTAAAPPETVADPEPQRGP